MPLSVPGRRPREGRTAVEPINMKPLPVERRQIVPGTGASSNTGHGARSAESANQAARTPDASGLDGTSPMAIVDEAADAMLTDLLESLGLPIDARHLESSRQLMSQRVPLTRENIEQLSRQTVQAGGGSPQDFQAAAFLFARDLPITAHSLVLVRTYLQNPDALPRQFQQARLALAEAAELLRSGGLGDIGEAANPRELVDMAESLLASMVSTVDEGDHAVLLSSLRVTIRDLGASIENELSRELLETGGGVEEEVDPKALLRELGHAVESAARRAPEIRAALATVQEAIQKLADRLQPQQPQGPASLVEGEPPSPQQPQTAVPLEGAPASPRQAPAAPQQTPAPPAESPSAPEGAQILTEAPSSFPARSEGQADPPGSATEARVLRQLLDKSASILSRLAPAAVDVDHPDRAELASSLRGVIQGQGTSVENRLARLVTGEGSVAGLAADLRALLGDLALAERDAAGSVTGKWTAPETREGLVRLREAAQSLGDCLQAQQLRNAGSPPKGSDGWATFLIPFADATGMGSPRSAELRISHPHGEGVHARHVRLVLRMELASGATAEVALQIANGQVSCATASSHDGTAALLRERFPSLREGLERLGYQVASATFGVIAGDAEPEVTGGVPSHLRRVDTRA